MKHARNRRCAPGSEAGMTLIEVMVAVVIEGLIVGALCAAFVGILRGSTQVSQSLGKSGDARVAANYIVGDARNSSGPETSLTDTTSCPDPNPPVAGAATPVVRFTWDSTNAAGASAPNVVNYVLVSNALLRRQCVSGTLVGDTAVAHSVQSVSVVCAPTANCTASPTSITATVTETTDSNGQIYRYSVNASFAKLIDTGAPAVPSSLVALGGGTCTAGAATGVSVAGTATIRVYGNTKINAPDITGSPACPALILGTSAGNYTAGGTQILSGGSCAVSGSSTCPAYTSYAAAIANPYAGLVAPSTAALQSQAGCPGGTAQPGVYAATLTISSNCVLAGGVYVLQAGLTVTGGSITSGAGGVLLYITGGAVSETGSGAVTLAAMSSGTYAGVLVWQANNSPISIANTGALTLTGAIYAREAQVRFSGSAVATRVSAVVSQSVALSSTATVSIGTASPLSIAVPASLPAWTVNRPLYPNTEIAPAGGDGVAYNWSATGLPTGMSINASSGVISGTPTVAGVKAVTVTVGDGSGDDVGSKLYSLTINAAPSITTASLPNGELAAAYSSTVAGSAGTAPYAWSASGLPAGLSMNASTGVISGTPTGTAGTASVVVTLTDAAGATATATLSLVVVNALSISTASLPAGEKTIVYSGATLAGSGGKTPYAWSASGLPAGLSIVSGTGVISGTPNGTAGTASVVVTLTDALGGTASSTLGLTVNPQPTISSVTLANGTGTAGTLDKGDTVTIVFSAQMSEASFCSTWTSGDGANPVLNASNNVTVSVANATNDTLSVTSTSCTFNFGSINLASGSYVSSATTFGGTGTSASTISWTATTRTLVITLGAKITGAVGNVTTSTPIYTASASVKDSVGAVLSNSPFTLAAGKKF